MGRIARTPRQSRGRPENMAKPPYETKISVPKKRRQIKPPVNEANW